MKASMRAKRMARNHRRMAQQSKLNLVSLMDIFTILVFFLMVNSGDIEVLPSDKSIKLPESTAEQKPDLALIITISPTDVIVQGRSVAKVGDVLAQSDNLIKGLSDELGYLSKRAPALSEEEAERGRHVIIMGDQATPYQLLKRVMATCADADYRDIALAVSSLPAGMTEVPAAPVQEG